MVEAAASRWREYPNRRAGQRHRDARRSIGAWPGERDALFVAVINMRTREAPGASGVFFAHLRRVWNGEREAVVAQGADRATADLAFVGRLGTHLEDCGVCASGGGAAWLIWACSRRPGLRLVVGAALREAGGGRMPKPWELPGAVAEKV